jgi:nitrite reductase (NADH) small subunit
MSAPHITAHTAVQAAAPHRLGPVEAIPIGEGRAFTVGRWQVAVFRLRDGTLRATQAQCPHAGGPLADGQLDLAKVVCPLHARAFSFTDGTCPEGQQITLYPAHNEAGDIIVHL